MGISSQTLLKEKFTLQKTFNELNNRIKTIEKELVGMKANLSAVHGALQEVEKLIQYDDNHNNSLPSRDLAYKGEPVDPGPVDVERPSLDIKPKEEPQQLNEGDK